MDNETKQAIRILENEREAKSQALDAANLRIEQLERQVNDLSGPDNGSVDTSNESQIDFIRRVAESRTKFAQEAKDIVTLIDQEQPSE